MGNVPAFISGRKQRQPIRYAKIKDIKNGKFDGIDGSLDSQYLLISALLPSSVQNFILQCEREVTELCGGRYERGKDNQRWGSQQGSIVIANHRVGIEKPRVRSKDGKEVSLPIYDQFQNPEQFEKAVFIEGLKRVSQRDYEKGLPRIANSFGFKKSQVSKRWVKATAQKIEELQKRDLTSMDIRAVFIDGKRFGKHGVIIALGVGSDGKKHVLGIYQSSTENSASCIELLNGLEARGLQTSGILFVVDGGSGLNKALEMKYDVHLKSKRRAIRARCHVHKWWNIEKALGKKAHEASGLFWSLRDAKNMTEAIEISDRLESILRKLNVSALASYLEAKEDLLVVHDLKLSQRLKDFFSTTNAIESLNSLIEEDMRRVKKWKDSTHFQRWLATYCLAAEARMRRVRGHATLPGLWVKLRRMTEHKQEQIDEIQEAV